MQPAVTAVNGPIALKNVAAFMATTMRLVQRDPHLPGFAVCSGPSGYGKTYASIFAQNRTRAIRVEVGESWTRKTLVQAVLFELGVQPGRGSIAEMVDKIKAELGSDPSRPLIIDEADKLVDKGHIELVREIQEATSAPVILIGEEQLPAKLERVERVSNRVLDWLQAQPCDIADVRTLAAAFCRGVTVSEDLLDDIRRQSQGRARRIVVNLARVMEIARNGNLHTVDRAAWGRAEFFTGTAPKTRRSRDLAVS